MSGPGIHEVRLFIGNGLSGTQLVGDRIFDLAVEGIVTEDFKSWVYQ